MITFRHAHASLSMIFSITLSLCLIVVFLLFSVSLSPTDHSRASSELDTAGLDNTLDSSSSSASNNNNNNNNNNADQSLNRSSSNPDLSPSSTSSKSISSSTTPSIVNGSLHDEEDSAFVVKVYRSDQSYKYFPLHKETTAKQVVMLAITEFGINEQSR